MISLGKMVRMTKVSASNNSRSNRSHCFIIVGLTLAIVYFMQILSKKESRYDGTYASTKISSYSSTLDNHYIFHDKYTLKSINYRNHPLAVTYWDACSNFLLVPYPKIIHKANDKTTCKGIYIEKTVEYTVNIDKGSVSLSPSMIAMLNSATNRFVSRIATITNINDGNIQPINKIRIFMTKNSSTFSHLSPHYNTSSYNSHSSNEEYLLAINNYGIEVYTPSVKGLLLALATLSQILNSPNRFPLSPYFVVHDWPDNNWRGMLVDVARHYQPIELLKRTISAMEVSKYNVLHLHLTDSQSFPILLEDTMYSVTHSLTHPFTFLLTHVLGI